MMDIFYIDGLCTVVVIAHISSKLTVATVEMYDVFYIDGLCTVVEIVDISSKLTVATVEMLESSSLTDCRSRNA